MQTREMAVGNTFGATALSSYGGFWIAFGLVLTPGVFEIEEILIKSGDFYNSFGLFLMGWFIFTFLLFLCTLRSTVAFCFLFFTLDMAFMLLGIGYLQADANGPQESCIVAGGAFGLMAAFAAWYNALAGIADSSNRYVFGLLLCIQRHDSMLTIFPLASSLFPSPTSPGQRRAVSVVTRSTTLPLALRLVTSLKNTRTIPCMSFPLLCKSAHRYTS